MKICFILPIFTRQPQGGYKMVFEYANRFVEKGHDVTIGFINENALKQFKVPICIRKKLAKYLTKKEPQWFDLDHSITKFSGWGQRIDKIVDETDICIATSVDTVDYVRRNFCHKKIVYFIQGYETWICDKEYVHQTYRQGMTNIVISDWLKRIVDIQSGGSSTVIKNPIDLNIYRIKIPIYQRKPHTVSLLYHTHENKGVKYAINALLNLKHIYPDLSVEMFGIFDRPSDLPEWFSYTKSASQLQTVDIYNKTQVFLCASVEEGYGLTGLEAMACGSVLVSTDYKGVHEYAENMVNSLLSPVKDTAMLEKNICRAFDDYELRKVLTENAKITVRQFSWDIAVDKFLVTIEK